MWVSIASRSMPQPVVEVVLPHRLVPLEQLLAAPDVVDQHVEPALLGVDALDQRPHLLGHEVVDPHGDAPAARRGDQLGGLLDRLRPVVSERRPRVVRPVT